MSQPQLQPQSGPAPEPHGQAHDQGHALPPLLSLEFFSLCAVSVLAFCNIAIFYGFYGYLTEIGIPPAWRGPLLALEPLTALCVRPFLGRFLTLGNGVRFMRAGMALATLSLCCYPFTRSIPALALVRVMHGLGFVCVVGGLMGTLIAFLPHDKSARGFGLFSITILVPYALMPPFVEFLLPHLPNHGVAYALAAPLMLPAFLLLIPLGRRSRALALTMPPEHLKRPSWGEVLGGLKTSGVALLVAANLFLVAGHSIVFFFMRDFAAGLGAANPGAFFTCANAATISVRILGARVLDQVDKGRTLTLAFLGLALLLPLFAFAGLPWVLFCLAALYGTGMALTMPLVNSSMVHISPPRLRAFNTNLLMVAVDAGFFAGPFLGGMIMAGSLGHKVLFAAGGVMMFAAALCVLPAARRMSRQDTEAGRVP